MDNVKDKIQKLLAMANAGDGRVNEHEAETAMRMAEKLMRQHNIDISELEASSGKQTVYNWTSATIATGERAKPMSWRPMWIGFLGTYLGRFTDCKVLWVQDQDYGHCLKFQGDECDIEYAAWLFKKLRDFGYAEAQQVPGKERDAFLKAYSIRLGDRMNTLRRERDAAMREAVTTKGTALMVVENKIALRDAEFGKSKTRNVRVTFSSQGFHAGRQAADRANFHRPIGSAKQARLS